MASTCPNCGKKLRLWNVKADCAQCGVSIPNYNWEARLEEDNIIAEKKFETFNRTMNRIAYSIWGTKLRIARLFISVIPALGFILPWATIKSSSNNFVLSILSFDGSKTLIDFFKGFFGDSGLFFANMKMEGYSGPVTLASVGYLLFVLSLLFAVIAFFMIIIRCKYPKTKATVIFDVISIATTVAAVVCFVVAGSRAEAIGAFNFGYNGAIDATGSIGWGYFVAVGLLVVAMVINIIIAKSDAKTDEQLEEERLARKAIKEEKEREEEEKRMISKAEAEKKAAEEEKEKIAKAKEYLAKKAEKKKK